ncbi:MAG: hypothetical protein R2764_06160 [Bacteroidales bacterium]
MRDRNHNNITGALTFYGNVTINNYFAAGSFVHYVYGNWTNKAELLFTVHQPLSLQEVEALSSV